MEWSSRLGWGLLVAAGVGAGHKLDGYFVQGNPLVGQAGTGDVALCAVCALITTRSVH